MTLHDKLVYLQTEWVLISAWAYIDTCKYSLVSGLNRMGLSTRVQCACKRNLTTARAYLERQQRQFNCLKRLLLILVYRQYETHAIDLTDTFKFF